MCTTCDAIEYDALTHLQHTVESVREAAQRTDERAAQARLAVRRMAESYAAVCRHLPEEGHRRLLESMLGPHLRDAQLALGEPGA